MRIAPALILVILVFMPGCESKRQARQKQEFTTLMDEKIRPITLSAEDRIYLDRLSGKYQERLSFLRDLAVKQKEDAIKSGMLYKVEPLNQYVLLIDRYSAIDKLNID